MRTKLRKPVSILASLVMVLGMSTTAFASDIDIPSDTSDSEPIEVSAAEFDKSTAVLLDRVVIEAIPGEGIMPYDNTYHEKVLPVEYTLEFSVDGDGTYFVNLSSEIIQQDRYFTKNILQIRPTNGKKWFKHETTADNITFYTDEMYFSYPDGAPDKVYVDVKYSFHFNYGYVSPIIIRLDNPGER